MTKHYKYFPYILAIMFIPWIALLASNGSTIVDRIEMISPVLFLIILAVAPYFLWKMDVKFRMILLPLLFLSTIALLYFYQQQYLLSVSFDFMRFAALLPLYYIIGEAIAFDFIFIGTPATNTFYMAAGAVLSNFIGGPAASLLLLKPFLRANRYRKYSAHTVVFFIIIVANAAAFLSPLSNTHLYMAFLKGFSEDNFIKFVPVWLVVVGSLLFMFYVVDGVLIWKEPQKEDPAKKLANALHNALRKEELRQSLVLKAIQYLERPTLRIAGAYNFWLFPLAILIIIMTSASTSKIPYREIGLIVIAVYSYIVTPVFQNKKNVAIRLLDLVFLYSFAYFIVGIVAGMIVEQFPFYINNITHAWFITAISGFMDNVPASIIIFNPEFLSRSILDDSAFFSELIFSEKKLKHIVTILTGISIFGGLSYIGNYVNIIIKHEAETTGVKMPNFFQYMFYSVPVILIISVISVLFLYFTP